MKRLWILIVVSVLVVGCTAKEPSKPAAGKIKTIQAAEVSEKLDNQETMILIIGTSTCGSCIEFDKVLKDYIQDHNTLVYSLKTDDEPTIKGEDGKEVRQQYLDLQTRIGKVTTTPTVKLIVNGEVKVTQSGGWNKKEWKQLMKDFEEIKNEEPTIGKINLQTAAEVLQAIQNGESLILVVGKTSCGACISFGRTIHDVLVTDDYTITEVLLDKEPRKEAEDGKYTLPDLESLEAIIGTVKGTPTTYRIENGVVVDSLFGTVSETDLRAFLSGFGA